MNWRWALVLVAAVGALGTTHVAEKLALEAGAGSGALALLRGAVAFALVGGAWCLRSRPALASWPPWRQLRDIALIGAVASGLVILLAVVALRETSATHKGAIQALYPAASVAFAVWLLGERFTGRTAAGLLLATLGLALLLSGGLAAAPRLGDWILLATVPMVGFTDAWSRRTLHDVSPLALAAGRHGFGLLALCLLLPAAGGASAAGLGEAWPWAVLSGLLAGVFVLALYVAMARLGVTVTAVGLAAAPGVTAVLDWLLLGEALASLALVGLLAIAVGVAVVGGEDR